MAISVTCGNCGKTLRVKDELAGRRGKCPGCQSAIVIPSPAAAAAQNPFGDDDDVVTPPAYAPASAAPAAAPARASAKAKAATRFDPNAAQAMKSAREKGHGRVSVNWGLIVLGALVLLVMVGIGLFITGPKHVWNEWEAIGDDANDAVISVVTRGLESHMSEIGAYNPRKPHGRPQATEVMFFRPSFVMKMPETVDFKGVATVGPFKGKYHPRTGEVEAEVAIGGGIGIRGSGGKTTAGDVIHVTGRVKNHVVTAEVDGKDAVIHMPPPDADD